MWAQCNDGMFFFDSWFVLLVSADSSRSQLVGPSRGRTHDLQKSGHDTISGHNLRYKKNFSAKELIFMNIPFLVGESYPNCFVKSCVS